MTTRKLQVTYTVPVLYSEEFETLVSITEGYSTEADIPKIISVSLWAHNRNADLIHVQAIKDVTPTV